MGIEVPTVAMLVTVGGISTVVTIVTEIVLRAANPSAATKDRFGPLLALTLGVAFGVVGAISQGVDPLTGILLGIVSGGGGMGIHDTVDSVVSS